MQGKNRILLAGVFNEIEDLFLSFGVLSKNSLIGAVKKILGRFKIYPVIGNEIVVVISKILDGKCCVHIHGTNIGECIEMTVPVRMR